MSGNTNKFDLRKKVQKTTRGNVKKPAKTYSNKEKMDLLKGYRKYEDSKMWKKLPIGVHVRVIKKDGKFVRGGFIKSVYDKDGKTYIVLENKKFNRQGKGYVQFRLIADTIQRIFVKVNSLKDALEVQQREREKYAPKDNNAEKKFDIMVRALKSYSVKMEEQKETIEEQAETIKDLKKRLVKLEDATQKIIRYLKEHPLDE